MKMVEQACEEDSALKKFFFHNWELINSVAQWVLQSEAMGKLVNWIHVMLTYFMVPEPHPNAEQIFISICAILATLVGYYCLFGKRHRSRRQRLQKELREAMELVRALELQLTEAELDSDSDDEGKKTVRIFMDGAFDLMHYGHMNAFRRGRSLGTHLVVGVNSDRSIKACKGPPVCSDEERMTMVEGCKFVDEVVPNCPYIMNEEYLKWVIEEYKIDYVVHGDDPCIVDGKDVYESARKMGKYRTIPRTEGVSTTDIVGRMLLMDRFRRGNSSSSEGGRRNSKSFLPEDSPAQLMSEVRKSHGGGVAGAESLSKTSRFLTTSRMLRLFSAGVRAPPAGAKLVYLQGAWDMFHAGHVALLKRARALGDYLVVGVHGDELVNAVRGLSLPLMALNERVLSVLGCKYADDVLIDCPWAVTREMIASLNICAVVHCPRPDCGEDPHQARELLGDPYKVPIEMGIFHEMDSPVDLTLSDILTRIHQQQDKFQKKIAKKQEAEDDYYANRYGFRGEAAAGPVGAAVGAGKAAAANGVRAVKKVVNTASQAFQGKPQ